LYDLVRHVPENGLYRYHLGMVLIKAGKPAEAKESLERALAANPAASYVEDARTTLAQLDRKSS
jgi:predicted Zn-dependent protease